MEPATKPDIVWNLNSLPYTFATDNTFDGILADQILEHTGYQGDYLFFFEQFEEFWRILVPGGRLFVACPRYDSVWAWGDPGHTRVLTPGSFAFLQRKQYEAQLGKTSMSDYRQYLGKQDWILEQTFSSDYDSISTLSAVK